MTDVEWTVYLIGWVAIGYAINRGLHWVVRSLRTRRARDRRRESIHIIDLTVERDRRKR